MWTVDRPTDALWCIVIGEKWFFCGMRKHGHQIEIFKMLGSLKLVTRIMYRENVNEVNWSNEEKDRTDSSRTWGLYVLNHPRIHWYWMNMWALTEYYSMVSHRCVVCINGSLSDRRNIFLFLKSIFEEVVNIVFIYFLFKLLD